ncbi:dihydrofolate reductase family protein [Arthrobacter sp. zg-ZUI100]|uniref:dihydrofolate reductase family protein n=1 Tax=Arthrobacter jiangjiafuii TaxID=2817475 RepID=UPI001AEDEC0C|nr:dihydrofolate reductase family protein [Arthrobacter jiangjiafuii]MBP3036401.1 dihydrofolate reductase family protein [Arthrobacter jiangjiafuii]
MRDQPKDSRTRVIAQEWVSLDGFASGPGGEADLFAAVEPLADAASQQWNQALLAGVAEVLLGRVTYELFVQYWPTADDAVARGVNTIPKTVFSHSLTRAPWDPFDDATVASDPVSYVRNRRSSGGDLLVWGSLSVVHALLAAGELDELDLFIAPVALGDGLRLFAGPPPAQLQLAGSEHWSSTLHVRYFLDRH